MSPLLTLLRATLPRAALVDSRRPGAGTGRVDRRMQVASGGGLGSRDVGSAVLLAAGQVVLVCGYAFLIALVCSAVVGPAP